MLFDPAAAYTELSPHFQQRMKRDEPLSRHSSFGVGGPADIWLQLETRKELIGLVHLCAEKHWPLLVVGNGSNSLFADDGVRGIVARTAMKSYTLEQTEQDRALLIADAGVNWPHLVHALAKQGWGGLEFGVGIPGSLGGALFSNAGAHNREIGEAVSWIEVIDARGANRDSENFSPPLIHRYTHDELDLGYRYSRLRKQHQAYFDAQGYLIPQQHQMIDPAEIVISLGLWLRRETPEHLQEVLAQYKRERIRTEPSQAHRGSIFKDPAEGQISQLIANVDMLGSTHGQAQIALDNANYIVNLGRARATDIIRLIEEAHRRVLERFGIDLQLDVELLGAWETCERGSSPPHTQ